MIDAAQPSSVSACVECGARALVRDPGPPCALESYTCAACGGTTWMHVYYALPDLPRARAWTATFAAPDGQAATKAFLRLKRILSAGNYFDFRLGDFESQFRRGLTEWRLGHFREEEVQRLERAFADAGLTVRFEEDASQS